MDLENDLLLGLALDRSDKVDASDLVQQARSPILFLIMKNKDLLEKQELELRIKELELENAILRRKLQPQVRAFSPYIEPPLWTGSGKLELNEDDELRR